MEQQKKINKEERHKKYIENIKRLTMEGKTQNQIAEELGVSRGYIDGFIKESKDRGTWFTKQELHEFRMKNSPKIEYINRIKKLTSEGKTQSEIAEELRISMTYISVLIKESKEKGIWFTKEELKEFKRKRQPKKRKRRKSVEARHKRYIEEIKRLTEEGKIQNEIAQELKISKGYIGKLVKESKEDGTWFTKEELNKFKRRKIPKKEYINEIKRLTMEGKTQNEMVEELGITKFTIANSIRESKNSGTWFTKEELNEFKRRKFPTKEYINEIKKLTSEGKTQSQIAQELKISKGYIGILIKKCKDSGTWFTKQELHEFRMKNSPKIEYINRIKKLTSEGKTQSEIAEELGISMQYVSGLIRESKEEGTWFTDVELEEIKQSKNFKKVEELRKLKQLKRRKQAEQNYNEYIKQIKRLTKEGKKQKQIAEELGLSVPYVSKLIQKSKKDGTWFTDEEIKAIKKENAKQKYRENAEKIKRLTEEGKTQKQIAEQLGVSAPYVINLIRNSKKYGTWFTDEEIEANKKEQAELKYRRYVQQIKRLTREGKKQKEISEELGISVIHINRIIRKSKEERTWFTNQELKEIRANKKTNKSKQSKGRKRNEQKYRGYIEQIKILTKEGKKQKQIAEELGLSAPYINILIRKSKEDGTWLSTEELSQIENVKTTKNGRKKVKKQEELGIEKFIEEIISLIRSGKTTKEVAKIMECSTDHIWKTRKKCIEEGTWISKEEEQELRKKSRNKIKRPRRDKETIQKEREEKRKKREEQERIKKEKILLKKQEYERKVENKLEEINNSNRIELKYSLKHSTPKPFIFLRKAAKQEDKAEYDGEEDVSTKGREAFIASVLKLHSFGWNNFTETDFQMITNSFFMHPELANKDIIKFIVLDALKKGGLNSALDAVNELMGSLGDTKYYKGLVGYNDWLRKRSCIPKIKAMKEQGLNNSQIGEKLRLTSAEVAVLFDSDEKADYKGLEEI